ncbi:MAG: Z1 domain-containing protein [Solibacillus sp.]|uniref:Z1 domain-containing protein n=1 Tax=Solibacillus sp. TaxID=1909654 RepID=UPI003314AFFA
MNLYDTRYHSIKNLIETKFEDLKDWNKVREIEFLSFGTFEEKLDIISQMYNLGYEKITSEIWNKLIDLIEEKERERKITKLGDNIKNDAKIPQDKNSSWQQYKKKLIKQKWSMESIESIEESSYGILRNLSMDTEEDGPVKGLVIGNVQSGKTANMAGLMALAADNGFNYFIILSGVIENLRIQTSERLFNDMKSDGNGNLHWNQIHNPTVRSAAPEHNISKFNLGKNHLDRYFTVCLKNSKRLEALIKWLESDENKAKQLKILVIDDEADQASINTKKIEEEDYTQINKLIRKLVNSKKFRGMNYIAYTATPYANVLNETSEDSLYPKDFIELLEPSDDYIGPKQIFGTEVPEACPAVDIVRSISDEDAKKVVAIQEGELNDVLPESFKKSIHWFIICVAAMRAIDYRKPITMLVHTSFKIASHNIIASKIEDYLLYFKNNYTGILQELKKLYEIESMDFKRSFFLEALPDYSSKESVPHYPSWELIEKYIERLVWLSDDEYVSHINLGDGGEPVYHKGFHLTIDNSRAKATNQIVRLVYPKKNQMPSTAPAFIVVGGNTLSRGLTLEGLTTTYFLRTTNQADTLMQMARWFGYRKGYEIFPRIWMDRLALQRYQFLSQMNEELREEIGVYAEQGLTPKQYAPRIKNSANYQLIRITSGNKMQSASPKEYDFAGFNSQTVYFENDEEKLQHNLNITGQFLNSLETPDINKNHMIWRNVDPQAVIEFLESYKVCPLDIKMSSLPSLLGWVNKNGANMDGWSVVFPTKGLDESLVQSEWKIHGYYPIANERSKLKIRSTEQISNIGALRTPADLLADLEADVSPNSSKMAEIIKLREVHGYGNVPQLIIYKIDKGEMTEEAFIEKNINKDGKPTKLNRQPLNFPKDIIGINVMIPGLTKKGDFATYISATVNIPEEDSIDEEQFIEE